jgi:ribonuclease P protein component
MPQKRLRAHPRPETPASVYCGRNEAHLPAEEAQAGQDPRVSGADEHPRGSRDPQTTSAQGPEAPHPIVAPKRRRLSRSGEFDRVYRDGSSHATRYLVLYSFPRRDDDTHEVRLGVSASRKLGGAVDRNRVKRVLREAFWRLSEQLPPDHDFVLVARPDIADLVESEGADGVSKSIEEALAGSSPGKRRST